MRKEPGSATLYSSPGLGDQSALTQKSPASFNQHQRSSLNSVGNLHDQAPPDRCLHSAIHQRFEIYHSECQNHPTAASDQATFKKSTTATQVQYCVTKTRLGNINGVIRTLTQLALPTLYSQDWQADRFHRCWYTATWQRWSRTWKVRRAVR